jgi:hypothetical protein
VRGSCGGSYFRWGVIAVLVGVVVSILLEAA